MFWYDVTNSNVSLGWEPKEEGNENEHIVFLFDVLLLLLLVVVSSSKPFVHNATTISSFVYFRACVCASERDVILVVAIFCAHLFIVQSMKNVKWLSKVSAVEMRKALNIGHFDREFRMPFSFSFLFVLSRSSSWSLYLCSSVIAHVFRYSWWIDRWMDEWIDVSVCGCISCDCIFTLPLSVRFFPIFHP